MKQLILLRHAKAKRRADDGTDEHRPLSNRGTQDAKLVGRYLRDLEVKPNLIVHSTAIRTTGTAYAICNELHPTPMTLGEDGLYLASEAVIMDCIRRTEPEVNSLLLVGHNPGIADLAFYMKESYDEPLEINEFKAYPPAACAIFQLDIDDWNNALRGHMTHYQLAEDLA